MDIYMEMKDSLLQVAEKCIKADKSDWAAYLLTVLTAIDSQREGEFSELCRYFMENAPLSVKEFEDNSFLDSYYFYSGKEGDC